MCTVYEQGQRYNTTTIHLKSMKSFQQLGFGATHPFSGSRDDMKAVIRRLNVHSLGTDSTGQSMEETRFRDSRQKSITLHRLEENRSLQLE